MMARRRICRSRLPWRRALGGFKLSGYGGVCEQLKGSGIELVYRGIDCDGGAALLAV